MRNQKGIASLVGVSLTAFLILVITLATATFMNGELQRATQTVDNTKANYDAQSGAEEAVAYIKGKLNGSILPALTNVSDLDQGCGDLDKVGSTLGTAIVCRQIITHTSEVTDSISNNNAVQFDLTNAPTQQNLNIDRVILKWDMKVPPQGAGGWTPATDPTHAQLQAPEASWPTGEPPLIELTATNYYPGQQSNIDAASSGTVFLEPEYNCPSGCLSQIDFQQSNKAKGGNQPVQFANCTAVGPEDYRCSADVRNISPLGYKTVLRLQSRYGDAKYDLKAYDYAQQQVQLPLANALVDVTATVGDTYSRTQLEVPLRSTVYPGFNALYGDFSLCKNFHIVSDFTGIFARPPDPGFGAQCKLSDDYVPPNITVTSIVPPSGPHAGGTAVKIYGTGFIGGPTTSVKIGNNVASFTVVSPTEIDAVTAATSPGSYEVIVTDSNGTSSGGPNFTYTSAGCAGFDPDFGQTFKCGLHGDYFNNTTASGAPSRTRFDPDIWWPDFVPDLKSLLGGKTGDVSSVSVHWTGQILLDPGNNNVCSASDDGAKLIINGTTLYDTFGGSIPATLCGNYNNTHGTAWWYPISIYYDNACCSWQSGGYYAEMLLYMGPGAATDNLVGKLRSP